MTQQTILNVASKAAARKQRTNFRLLKELDRRATITARSKEIARHTDVQEKLLVRRQKIERMHMALQAVAALCAVGLSRQFQSLIKARGQSLILWGGEKSISPGYDMADIWWKWVSRITLTSIELRLENHTETSGDYGTTYTPEPDFALYLPYGMYKAYIHTRPFWHIATPYPIDWSDLGDPRDSSDDDDINFVYSTEKLFEILVECGDSRKFGKLFRAAIRR